MLTLVDRLLRHTGWGEVQPHEMALLERLKEAGCGEHYIAGVIRSGRKET